MDNIFITLKTPNLADIDLKIPAHITGAEFIKMLAEITVAGIPKDSKIQAEPLGRILDNSQTFYAEGVGHGALLTIL